MKSKWILLFCVLAFLPLTGSDCINDPFVVAINLEVVKGEFGVNTGNGAFDDTSRTYVIQDLIDNEFKDKIQGFRLYDIRVHCEGPYPDGGVSGSCFYTLDGGIERQFLSFSGQYSQFAEGVSLLNPGSPPLVTRNAGNLAILLNALNDINNLPREIQLRGVGAGPAVDSSFAVIVEIFLQADAEL